MRKFIRLYNKRVPFWIDADEIVMVGTGFLCLRGHKFEDHLEITTPASKVLAMMDVEAKTDD